MANPSLPPEKIELAKATFRKRPEWSIREVADFCDISLGSAHKIKQKVSDTEDAPAPKKPSAKPDEVNEIAGDQWRISLPQTRIQTLEELIAHCKVDLQLWEVSSFKAKKWDMGYKDKNEEGRHYQLFAVAASFKKKKHIADARYEIEELKALAKRDARAPILVKRSPKLTGNMLELDIMDAHLGKLSWGVETGGANYDTKIAAVSFSKASEVLLQRASAYEFDEILLTLGNDLANADTPRGQTYNGTPVDNDTRYFKTFRTMRTCAIDLIERLRTRAKKVIVKVVPGNHDSMTAWHLGDSLECYFHRYDDVVIDNEPRERKYHQFGKVMLMWTHGDKGKRADYPLLMATEQPEMFGATKFREAHTGHLHSTRTEEFHGVRVRIIRALCPSDAWHAANGYTGNLRGAEAFIWNAEEGLVNHIFYTEQG